MASDRRHGDHDEVVAADEVLHRLRARRLERHHLAAIARHVGGVHAGEGGAGHVFTLAHYPIPF